MMSEVMHISKVLIATLSRLPLAAFLKDTQGHYQWCNYAWQELIDLDLESVLGKSDGQIFSTDIIHQLQKNDQACLQLLSAVRDDVALGDPSLARTVQIFRVPVLGGNGLPVGILGIAVDASIQHLLSVHVEGLLDEMEAQRSAMHQHALVSITNGEGRYTYVSDPFCRLTGFTREELIVKTRFDLGLVPSHISTPSQFIGAVGKAALQFEAHTTSKDGSPIWLQSVVVKMRQMNELDTTYFEISNDISEIKNREAHLSAEVDRRTLLLRYANHKLEADVRERALIEENLRQQHALVNGILASLPEEIVVLNDVGRVIQVNRVWQQFQEDMMLKNTIHDLTIGDDFLAICKQIKHPNAQELFEGVRAVQCGAVPDVEVTYEESSRFGTRWYSIRITVWESAVHGLLISFHDISEAKQHTEMMEVKNRELHDLNAQLQGVQTQLVQSEKMASIGQLSAGVAHEINNPLGFINSNVSTLDNYIRELLNLVNNYHELLVDTADASKIEAALAFRKTADFDFINEDVQLLMGETRDGIDRVKRIVQSLKDFSRLDSTSDFEPSDIHLGLNSTLNIVNNEIKYKCEVIKDYAELPLVDCMMSSLNQVFLNLLVNAGHAITETGQITIKTSVHGDQVCIAITDTGKGIEPDNLKRIFDPFFTTKPIGQGTGLGLSLSYGIVQKHQGRIEVSSVVGVGTTFMVWLPIHQPKVLS